MGVGRESHSVHAHSIHLLAPCSRHPPSLSLPLKGGEDAGAVRFEEYAELTIRCSIPRWPRRRDRLRNCIPLDNYPLAATERMLPIFLMRTLRVVEQEHMVVPDFWVGRAVRGACLIGIAAIAEFAVVARAAMGAGEKEHSAISVCES